MQAFSEVYPHLRTATDVPTLVKIADVNWDQVDAAFCCLPHATTQETLAQLPKHIKIVDLSADFRLKNVNTYAEWYVFPCKCCTVAQWAGLNDPVFRHLVTPKHALHKRKNTYALS